MDTKFPVAVHIMIIISESSEPVSSAQMALSVGTNASYIRKIIALLSGSGLISSHRGVGGYSFTKKAADITLLEIYQAVMDEVSLFDIHQNPSDQCIVGRHIKPVLTGMFRSIGEAFEHAMAGKTLADCIQGIRKEADMEEANHENN